ncbi:MAG TPA: hypothetical protein VN457_01625 [Chlamydiales bacterium]|nr:hypothetical protein [Chlamydiales bacterium]
MKKILVVNDDKAIQSMVKDMFGSYVEVLQAFTLAKAQELYTQNKDAILIVVDGSVETPKTVDTIPFVEGVVRDGYLGVLLAASQDTDPNVKLMQAGCHYSISEGGANPSSNFLATIRRLIGSGK